MKKMMRIALIVLAGVVLFGMNVQAADNFFCSRWEFAEKVDGSDEFIGTHNVFENNSLDGCSLGAKVVTGANGFKRINPYVFKHLPYNFQIGMMYAGDSSRNEVFGPTIRFKGKIWKLFVILDYAREIHLKDGLDKNDVWLHVNTTNPNFNIGFEVWHFDFMGGGNFTSLRPIRLNYQFSEGFGIFLMPNFQFKNSNLDVRSIMTGAIVKW